MTNTTDELLRDLGISDVNAGAHDGAQFVKTGGAALESANPTNESRIASVTEADEATLEDVVRRAAAAFEKWRLVPAPRRGEIVREIGEALRAKKAALGKLVSLEMGKILSEGEGEVQEMIDIADFAVGLSRQLCGQTMHSERAQHRMYEQWQPLGIVGVITAFNFPSPCGRGMR